MSTGVRRPAHGVTALRGGRTWRLSPYAVFGGLFWLVMTLAYWRVPLCCDAGQHAAVVERLKADLLHPAHPMADLPGAGSPYYSPYAVAQGALARLTGLSGWEAVRLAGPVNLAVLLTGIGRFVRTLTPRPWAPVLAVLFMTLLWGTERVLWSGYLGLMSMTTNLGYPSAFAIGLTFWAWAMTGTHARGAWAWREVRGWRGARAWRGYAGLGVLYGLIVLVHPITAVASLTGAVAIVAAWQRSWRGPVVGWWALTGAVALAVALAWPYFDVLALPGNTGVDGIHRRLYEHMGGHFWLALLGVPALWARARRAGGGRWWRAGRDPLVLMFALECLVVAYGWTSDHYTYGRILGLTAVPPQFALAVELAAPRPWGWARRALGAAAAAGACVGFLAQAGAVVPRSLDPVGFAQPPQWPGYGWAARHIRPGEVVITDGYYAGHAIAGYGPNLVAPTWPDPALDERERARRLAAVRAYLDPASTRAERTAIARRYHVRWLLLTRWRKVPEEAVVVDRNRRTGEVLARLGAAGRSGRLGAEPATR
ncbi:hypothetical protein [Streptomyces acidicola]|uniref:Integral membrane protein n=1 Tax=Streptomyces acidicola TaxID=2596892 RepID=A0A5N8X3D9_9ACTN|nr:hypothetical protein [Streptomyces acidicola]MPY53524.1 hypothetical protein [Streptomyces acidicola]